VIVGADFVDPAIEAARIVMKGRAQAQIFLRNVVIDFGIDPEGLPSATRQGPRPRLRRQPAAT
jgi:hypothetical protein